MGKELLGSIELNRIYQMDCLEGMKLIPDKSINMILCDLPYGTTSCKWDTIIPFDKLWKQYERIITNNGAIILFGTEPFSSMLRMSNIKLYKYDFKWIKDKPTNFINCNNAPMRLHENIMVFSKGMTANGSNKNMIYNPQGLIEVNKRAGIAVNKDGDTLGSRPSREKYKGGIQKYTNYPVDVLNFSNKIKDRVHPTQKPVELCEYLLKTYTGEGEVVLDNCIGSGTTAVACILNKRKWIGFETESKYIELANKRLDQIQLEDDLKVYE